MDETEIVGSPDGVRALAVEWHFSWLRRTALEGMSADLRPFAVGVSRSVELLPQPRRSAHRRQAAKDGPVLRPPRADELPQLLHAVLATLVERKDLADRSHLA